MPLTSTVAESAIMEIANDTLDVQLTPMPQLVEAVNKEDDWTGLTSPAARRKRQNRLNQRAYRRRKALEAYQAASSSQHECLPLNCRTFRAHEHSEKALVATRKCQRLQLLEHLMHNLNDGMSADKRVILPLSTDHLIILIHFNVFRAVLTNMAILQKPHKYPDECGDFPLKSMPLYPGPAIVPPQLEPTALQNSIPHEDWIDLIPSPTMRDNCIRLSEVIDEDELCSDLVGGLFEGETDIEKRGWIVWKDPWDVAGWEITEGFVQKWGFVLKGCKDVLEATNRWRRLRGENDLVVEV